MNNDKTLQHIKIVLIAILLLLIANVVFKVINENRNRSMYIANGQQNTVSTTDSVSTPNSGTSESISDTSNDADCGTPSIAVTSPASGAQYRVGDKVTIVWTGCNVDSVNIELAMGAKDFGTLGTVTMTGNRGQYTWTAANPGFGYTDNPTNSYELIVSDSSGVMARSGRFTVSQ